MQSATAVNKCTNSIFQKPTPLHFAASHGLLEIVKCLIKNGADVNASTKQLRTPLNDAADSEANSKHKVIEVLLNHGADLDCRDVNGTTPLMIASQQGHLDLVKTPLDAGADPNALDYFSNNTLILSEEARPLIPGHKAVFAYFLAPGLDRNFKNAMGVSAMQVAMQTDQFASFTLNEVEGCSDGTALIAACRAGRLESAVFLVRRKAILSYNGLNGFQTAFDKRTSKGILQWLLVTRITDQGKIEDSPDDSPSSTLAIP
ncbi:ankyrin repeat-containing domain protein [Hypoxylon sp. NC0597]|nr:ankyrin repeat-containing domain protein [Hypoxylon sp. NC0597]